MNYTNQILRKMADEAISNVTRGQEEQADEQEEALLIRARDALYLTMDRTRDNKHHVNTFLDFSHVRKENLAMGTNTKLPIFNQ